MNHLLMVVAVALGVSGLALVLAHLLGLFGPNSRVWHNALFGALWGAVLLLAISALEPLPVRTPPALFVMISTLLGLIAGALAGLAWSFGNFLDRHVRS